MLSDFFGCKDFDNNEPVEILIIFRNVRYNRIKISAGNKVVIVAKNKNAADRIIKEKKRWIEKKLIQMKEMERKANIDNGKCYFFGIEKNSDEVFAALPKCRSLLFSHVVDYLSQNTTFPPSISIRRMYSRLGAYSAKKDEIKLSAYLFFLPKEMIEYIVFHELAHRNIRNHGKKFWTKIAERYTDWKKKEEELDLWWLRVKLLLKKYPALRKI